MSTEQHYYFSRVLQEETNEPAPAEEDCLPISFYLVKQSRCWNDETVSCVTSPGARSSSSILFSCRHHRRVYTELMASHLSRMGVPQEERPTILEKLFHVVQAAVPGGHIFVLIADVTVRLLGSFNDHGNIAHPLRESTIIKIHVNKLCFKTYEIRDIDYHIISTTDTVASESLETYRVKFIPATRSSIEGLQRVRLDSLEEPTIKQNLSCSICMNEFAQGGVDQLITHLPCSHRYHVVCIIRWLETSHVCPLCRYPLPSVEDGEPSNS